MLSDRENLDIMLRGNHLEKEESEYHNSSRRSISPNLNTHENDEENITLTLGKIYQVTVPNTVITPLVLTQVLSSISYQVNSI